MSQPRRRRGSGKQKNKQPKPKALDLWRPVPLLPAPERIVPVDKPTTLVRSLGDPPLQGQGKVAEHYVAAVVESAATLARALAASADLLGSTRADDD